MHSYTATSSIYNNNNNNNYTNMPEESSTTAAVQKMCDAPITQDQDTIDDEKENKCNTNHEESSSIQVVCPSSQSEEGEEEDDNNLSGRNSEEEEEESEKDKEEEEKKEEEEEEEEESEGDDDGQKEIEEEEEGDSSSAPPTDDSMRKLMEEMDAMNSKIQDEKLMKEMEAMNEQNERRMSQTNFNNDSSIHSCDDSSSRRRAVRSRGSFVSRMRSSWNSRRCHSTGELTELASTTATTEVPLKKERSHESTTTTATSSSVKSEGDGISVSDDGSSDDSDDEFVSPWSDNCTGLKIMFLSSDTGGGHRASAESLANFFQLLYPGSEYILEDIMTDHAPRPYKNLKAWYKHLSQHPNQWNIVYKVSNTKAYQKFQKTHCRLVAEQSVRNRILNINPDVIISVHPLMNSVPVISCRNILSENNKHIPMFTVVTDLGSAHTSWFDKDVQGVFIASSAIKQIAIKQKIPPNKIIQTGLPIRHEFTIQSQKLGDRYSSNGQQYQNSIRKKLNLISNPNVTNTNINSNDNTTKIILVMGGGEGCGALSNIVHSLYLEFVSNNSSSNRKQQSYNNIQIVVVCGRNEKLKQSINSRYNNNNNSNKNTTNNNSNNSNVVKVISLGFVTQMAEYMVAADVLVSKAGPGTIAEAAALSLPVMLTSFLPGQEEGNVDFVIDNSNNSRRFGSYISDKNPLGIAKEVMSWFTNSEKLKELSDAAKLKGSPNAAKEIVHYIGISTQKYKDLNIAQEQIDNTTTTTQHSSS